MIYIAFLRGINVGGNNRIEMKKLVLTFESLGFTNIKTYINSGNIIFKSAKKSKNDLASLVEKRIMKDFSLPISVVVQDITTLRKICDEVPKMWINNSEVKTDIMFLWNKINNKKILKEFIYNPEIEHFKYVPGALIWNIKKINYGKSKIPKKILSKELYQMITIRNVNTLRKLYEMMSELK